MKMSVPQNRSTLILIGVIFVLVLVGVVVTLVAIGGAYKRGLSSISDNQNPAEYELTKRKEVKRITIQRGDESGCIEVTPDGVVRVYEECGGELSKAARYTDPKSILRLFKLVRENDLSQYQNTGTGETIQLTIETDEGTQVVTIVVGGGNDEDIEEIIETIENIEESYPDPTPSPSADASVQPSASPGSSPNPSGSPTASGSPPPSGETGGSEENPFTCSFDNEFENKPYRVSNVVCTDEPQPGEPQ